MFYIMCFILKLERRNVALLVRQYNLTFDNDYEFMFERTLYPPPSPNNLLLDDYKDITNHHLSAYLISGSCSVLTDSNYLNKFSLTLITLTFFLT